ncbi:MAG: hypothetical protein ACYT04_13020 [Nostoc sp.]
MPNFYVKLTTDVGAIHVALADRRVLPLPKIRILGIVCVSPGKDLVRYALEFILKRNSNEVSD